MAIIIMEKTIYKDVWIRVAGHSQMIKGRGEHHWRCYLNRRGEEISLVAWKIDGLASHHNMMHGTNPDKDENGLVAWIDFYGDVVIENGIAQISLKPVTK